VSVAASVYLSCGWLVYAFDPVRSWACLVLFALAVLAMVIDGVSE
jgi:hypothetical protein